MFECFEASKSIKSDRNRIRNGQRFSVVQCEDLNVQYYREHEMRGIKRPQLCVVPKEYLRDILENAHNELSHARRDRMHNQWVCYITFNIPRIFLIIGVLMPLPILCIGRTPPDISVDMSLPREAVLPLETEDQLEQALGSRQVIKYASQDAATPIAIPSSTPIPLSHLSLQESASDVLLAAVPLPESSPPHLSRSYDLVANDFPSDPFLLGSQQANSDEDNDSPTASPPLTPVPHLLRESYDDSYDMSV